MRFNLQVFVKAGDALRVAEWNILGQLVRSLRLIAGMGIRLRETPDGTIVSVDDKSVLWDHPFRCDFNGTECRISPGEISTVHVKIGGIPLDGGKDNDPPVLKVPKPVFDKDGRGYIAIEVKCDKNWGIVEAYPVQVAYLESDDGITPPADITPILGGIMGIAGQRARHPILMMRQRKDGTIKTIQICHHSLQHRARTDSLNKKVARHFFFV